MGSALSTDTGEGEFIHKRIPVHSSRCGVPFEAKEKASSHLVGVVKMKERYMKGSHQDDEGS